MAYDATVAVDIPKIQQAWRSVRRGSPSKSLELQSDVPVPSELKDGEVLIKVEAAALNPVGYKTMKLLPNFMAGRPNVAEFDLAGTIADQRGTKFARGDKVIGWSPVAHAFKTGQGALAQYTRLPGDFVVTRPESIKAEEGAGMLLAGMTAYLALADLAKVEPGQSVFINGGSTAVGSFAIQIAKAKGYKAVASCSAKNFDYVRGLGADEVLDYNASPLYAQLTTDPPAPKFQVVFDCVGLSSPDLYSRCAAYLAPSGTFVSVGPQPGGSIRGFFQLLHTAFEIFRPTRLGGVKAKWVLVRTWPKKPFFDEFHQLIVEGKVKPMVDSTFEFDAVMKAYERLLTGRAKGKVVVKIPQ